MTSQDVNNARFTQEAAAWDANVKHVESTERALEAVTRFVPGWEERRNGFDVLEIGCGTGLLSFKLAPLVRSLVGVDTADGMIAAFDTKLADLPESPNANLCAINHYLTSADSPELQGAAASLASARGEEAHVPYRFDLVVSHLTLHHIPSLPEIFTTILRCLKPGGMIALTDYEDFGKEAIRFHPESKRPGVERHGIRKFVVEELLVGLGYCEVRVEEAFVLRKEVDAEGEWAGEEMAFPFLMIYGVRGRD